jgi:hypothetical protein
VLFIGGGTIAGIYTLGVVLIGTDFRGQRLAVVSTGFAMAYAAGSIVGSTPVGYLIDLLGAEALPISIAACFLGLTIFLLRKPAEERRPAVAELPEIEFDLSFLTVERHDTLVYAAGDSFLDDGEPSDIEQAEVADLHMRNHDQWQERHLEKWFRWRSDELAGLAAKRYGPENDLACLTTQGTGR